MKQFSRGGAEREATMEDALALVVTLFYSPSVAIEVDLYTKGVTRNETDSRLQKKHLLLERYEKRWNVGFCWNVFPAVAMHALTPPLRPRVHPLGSITHAAAQ